MPDTKQDVLDMLSELAELTMLEEGDPQSFRVRAYALHLDINCGCFAKPEPLTGITVLRDGALFLLAVLMTVFAFQEARKPHPWAAPAPEQSS